MRQTDPARTSSVPATDERKDYKVDVRLDHTLMGRLEAWRPVFGSRSAVIREALTRLT